MNILLVFSIAAFFAVVCIDTIQQRNHNLKK